MRILWQLGLWWMGSGLTVMGIFWSVKRLEKRGETDIVKAFKRLGL
jgi:hypothetical protein